MTTTISLDALTLEAMFEKRPAARARKERALSRIIAGEVGPHRWNGQPIEATCKHCEWPSERWVLRGHGIFCEDCDNKLEELGGETVR